MKKITNIIEKLELVLGTLALAGFFISILLQVLSRYVPIFTVIWADEVSRFLFIWSVLLGTSIMAKKNAHFSFEVLREGAKGRKKLIIELIINLLLIGFGIYMLISGIKLTTQFWNWSFNSLPWLKQRYTWSAIAVSGFSIALFSIDNLLEAITLYRKEN